jgi:hypothetical protein
MGSSSAQHPEYPSAREIGPTHWAISTGSGSLYILETTTNSDDTFAGNLIAKYDLRSDDRSEPSPFLIQAVHCVSETEARILLYRTVALDRKEKGKAKDGVYEILEISVDPTRKNRVDEGDAVGMEVNWRMQGGDLPVWCSRYGDGWIVLSSETYSDKMDNESEQPIVQNGEAIRDMANGERDGTQFNEVSAEKEWPFAWTQDAENINITIPLPKGISRKDITVDLQSSTFSLVLKNASSTITPVLSAFFSRGTRTFWASIDVSESTWTFDSSKSSLDIDLVKVDKNTRWPSIFLPIDEDDDAEEEEEVPETLSAETLAAVKATFENVKTRQANEPESAHAALPGLLREEMDYEFEDDEGEGDEGGLGDMGGKVGRDVFVGYLQDGKGSWSKGINGVISVPITGSSKDGIIIKSGVDGLLFTPPSSQPNKTSWVHTTTSPALSFVLSSKPDLRLVRHIRNAEGTVVLAFESGSSVGSGNAFAYYPPTSSTTAAQGVVGVCGSDRGTLLGVGSVDVGGKEIVIALCEKELVVLHGVV